MMEYWNSGIKRDWVRETGRGGSVEGLMKKMNTRLPKYISVTRFKVS
jgi:hypothetical protein